MTTQPAGEHHTGTLDLTGEGNTPSVVVSDEMAAKANEIFWSNYGTEQSFVIPDDGTRAMRLALEAALPALRRQITEEIAVRADQIAENYQATAVAHRDLSDSQTPKGQRHTRTAHAFRNKADGAWAVAHAVREIGAKP